MISLNDTLSLSKSNLHGMHKNKFIVYFYGMPLYYYVAHR